MFIENHPGIMVSRDERNNEWKVGRWKEVGREGKNGKEGEKILKVA